MDRITEREYKVALEVCKQYLHQVKEEIKNVSELESKYPFKDEPLKILGLSERPYNLLRQNGAFTIYQLLDKFTTQKSLSAIEKLGEKSVREICFRVKDIYRIEIK